MNRKFVRKITLYEKKKFIEDGELSLEYRYQYRHFIYKIQICFRF